MLRQFAAPTVFAHPASHLRSGAFFPPALVSTCWPINVINSSCESEDRVSTQFEFITLPRRRCFRPADPG
jgi:hypothetical protein